ncbi:MAG: alpha/beta fold hydrolase [Treponema sp.]|nr:alpha/beta fold hydrolase [Treponema sp.]
MKNLIKPLSAFLACIFIAFLSLGIASLIQTGFGRVSVSSGFLEVPGGAGPLAYKLYVPEGVDASRPAPAALVMHGYQNDRETSAAYSIELARRGIVALSVDLYGHGFTPLGMRGRGWGDHPTKNPSRPNSGPGRFRIFMSFSSLNFFKSELSSGLKDSSMGGIDAYSYLQSLPFVDASRIAITGHSMGTWAAWSVAAAHPDHKAVVLQCGEPLRPENYDSSRYHFNNLLLIQARWDEFDYFRDFQKNVIGLEKTPLRYHDLMNQESPVEWDRTYGSFEDGSARRMELIQTNHRLTTHDSHALSTAMDWFTGALEVKTDLPGTNLVFMIKEVLALIAMIAALVSMLPGFLLLKSLPFLPPSRRA